MYNTNNALPTLLQEQTGPSSVNGGDLLTLLQKYQARLEDVELAKLHFEKEETPQPVKDGETILLKEMLNLAHQVKPITARLAGEKYEGLEGETLARAMKELGYHKATVVLIECPDEEVFAVRTSLLAVRVDVPYSIRLAKFNEVKASVKASRKELKAEGGTAESTDYYLTEVLGAKRSYVKELAKIANSPDWEEKARRLDEGETIHSVTRPPEQGDPRRVKGVPAPQEPRPCEIPAEYDMEVLCPDCPKRLAFMAELETKQEIIRNGR